MSAGILNVISLKKETTWGTPVVPDKSIPVRLGSGMATDNNIQLLSAARGVLSKNIGSFIGARKHEGEYEMDFFGDYTAYLLSSAFGGVSSALKGGESVVYNHTLTESETKPSFTIEQVVGENVRRYAGAIASGFKISGKAGDVVSLNIPLKAKSQASATKITPAYTTVRPFNFVDSVVKIGGSQLSNVTAFELEYSNNIEFGHALNNSNDAAFNYVKGSEVKGKLEIYLDNTSLTEYNNYLSKTDRALDFEFTGDTIGTASNYKVTVNVPKAAYTMSETKLGEDYNLLVIEFTGIYDPATSRLLNMVVTNLLANLN
jgi:Phage tail tube protein